MLTKKGFQRLALCLLQLLQARPSAQQIENRWCIDLLKPVHDLRKVDFEASREPITLSCLLVHPMPRCSTSISNPMPALFYEHQQATRGFVFSFQHVEAIAMMHQQF